MKILISQSNQGNFALVLNLIELFPEAPEIHRVKSFATAIAALEADAYDVCLLDYMVGPHTALDILNDNNAISGRTAFIVFLETNDHDIDKLVLQHGATDSLVIDQLSEVLLERSIRYAVHRKEFQMQQVQFAKERELLMKERELLLKEVEHRVKNNLQVVAGLLSWEGNEAENEQVRGVLQKAQSRIQTMMLIHEKLYQSSHSLHEIDFNVYAPELLALILESYGFKPGEVSVNYEMPYSILDLTTAVPCSLILTELVSNCLTHAAGIQPKNLVLALRMRKYHNHLHMVVKDNGIGLINLQKRPNSFGLRLISLLVGQLNGKIRFVSNGGLAVHIRFPE